MLINESELKSLVIETDGTDELYEGISDIFKKIRLKKFAAKFMEKGQDTVYFAYSRTTGTFAKAVFDNGKLVDTVRYDSMEDMESDISMLQADGYAVVKEAGVTRTAKFIIRNLGRLLIAGGIVNFIAATIVAVGAGFGIAGTIAALPAVAVTAGLGWMLVTVAKKEDAMTRDHGGVARSLKEGVDSPDDIRKLVRDAIIKQSEEITKKKEKS